MTNGELAIRIQNGETQLYSQLWENVKKLFYMLSDRFYKSHSEQCTACGVELEDIHQTCFLSLCSAVGAYKHYSEYDFTTYINYSFKNAVAALLNGGHRRQVTDPLNISTSLDVPLSDDTDTTKADLLPDDNAEQAFKDAENDIYTKELNKVLQEAMKTACSSREIEVLRHIYWNHEKQTTVAKSLNLSYSEITKTHEHALLHLQKPAVAKKLYSFYEFIQESSYKGTGVTAFRTSGRSSVERVVEQWEYKCI